MRRGKMIIGYARISTDDQKLDLQIDALNAAGCDRIFSDVASGRNDKRPGLVEVISHLREGDTLIVWKLDRLGRSLKHLIDTAIWLNNNGMYFKSLTESIDTSTSTGKLLLAIFGALAEFEKDLIHERTMAGLAAARSKGRVLGRKPSVSVGKVEAITQLINTERWTVRDACKEIGVSIASYYRLVNQVGKIKK